MNEKLDGQNISKFWTIGSWYANGYLKVFFTNENGKEQQGRFHVTELIKMVNEFTFELKQSRTFVHLVNPERKEEEVK